MFIITWLIYALQPVKEPTLSHKIASILGATRKNRGDLKLNFHGFDAEESLN
jgi:hypothetical protein